MPARKRVPAQRVEVEFVLLADAAQAVQQKLYVLGGGWNQVTAPSYPLNHPMAIACAVLVPWNLTNETHTVSIDITDEDGTNLLPTIPVTFRAGRPAHLKPGSVQRAVFGVQGLFGLPHKGSYTVRVSVGESVRSVAFDAVEGAVAVG